MNSHERGQRLGWIQIIAAVIAGLCFGDTWFHSLGITCAIYALSPFVTAY